MRTAAALEGEPLRALIVDDDELDRISVRRFLRAAGFDVTATESASADAALRVIEQECFDCVLLDFNLGTRDGLYVLQQLRARGHRLPVIVLTGQDDPEIAVALMKNGASDYLAKASLTAERLGHSLRTAGRLFRAEEAARAAQDALRASEELNRRILASSADRFEVLDLDGRLLSMSDAGARALGMQDASSLIGRSWIALWDDAERESAEEALRRARAGDKGRFVGSSASPTGQLQWWDVLLTPMLDAQGKPERLLATSRDVTELKQREAFEQELVGIVSHDLRNPLNAILVGVELLLRRDELDERTTRALRRVRSSADRAARMIHDLLDFTQARLGGGIPVERATSDLAQLVTHVVDEVSLAWVERDIVCSVPDRLEGEWDGDRISQVLTNLLSNALQYSPADTKVTCRLRQEDQSAVIEVHNFGAPIPAELLPRLFEPLQRAARAGDNSGRSIGLGLYIVKQLVRAHAGRIDVRSAADEGTTITVRLPLRG